MMMKRERRVARISDRVFNLVAMAVIVGLLMLGLLFGKLGPPLDWWEDGPDCPGAPTTTAC